jgi:hypothetical protein
LADVIFTSWLFLRWKSFCSLLHLGDQLLIKELTGREVDQLDVHVAIEDNVAGLQIPMHYLLTTEIVKG